MLKPTDKVNGFTVMLVRHGQTKEMEQISFVYGTPRQSSTP
jgi:hypothetical protein